MDESIERRKTKPPLKIVVNIQDKAKIMTVANQNKIQYAPGILKFINALVEEVVRRDLDK